MHSHICMKYWPQLNSSFHWERRFPLSDEALPLLQAGLNSGTLLFTLITKKTVATSNLPMTRLFASVADNFICKFITKYPKSGSNTLHFSHVWTKFSTNPFFLQVILIEIGDSSGPCVLSLFHQIVSHKIGTNALP